MRQKRAKAYKRLMQTYSLTFGFRQPYQVLGPSRVAPLQGHPQITDEALASANVLRSVDAEFCQTITKAQVDVEKMLETVCQGKCKPSASSLPLAGLERPAGELISLCLPSLASDHSVLDAGSVRPRP
jgi:hypothetical protein